jgi:hypothetical protein
MGYLLVRRIFNRKLGLLMLVSLIALLAEPTTEAAPGTKINTPNTPIATAISNCVTSPSNCATSINVSFTVPTSPSAGIPPAGTIYTIRTYSSSDNGATFTVLSNSLNTTAKSTTVTGLSANTSYKVTVIANGSGSYVTSDESNRSSTVTTKPYLAQAQPTVQAVVGTVDTISVAFAPVSNAGSYSVQVYLDSNKATVGSLQTNFVSGSNVEVTLNQNTSYVVKVSAVTNNTGYATSISEFSAAVTTNAEAQTPSTTNPVSLRKNPGQSATFSVVATAADSGVLSYRWQVSVGSDAFTDIPGEVQETLTLDNLSSSQNQNKYRVIVRNTLNGTFKETTSARATLTVAISSDTSLSSLTVSPGTISPAFVASVFNYSIAISATVTSLTVNAVPTSDYSSVTVNGSAVAPIAIDTNSTSQTFTVRVTAEDLSTKDYVVSVKRVIVNKTSEIISPNTAPTSSATQVQSTKQIIQNPSAAVLPRVNSTGALSVTSGPVGTVVTINGSGFNSVLSVKINGANIAPSDPSLITPTSITVMIPVGARSGTIVVTTSKGSVSTPRFIVTS